MKCFVNVSELLQQRFLLKGDLDDLQRSVNLARKATLIYPSEFALYALGMKLHTRFEHLRDSNDLNESIHLIEDSVAMDAVGMVHRIERADRLNTLGLALKSRYKLVGEHNNNSNDLQLAITKTKEAIDTTPPEHPSQQLHQNNYVTCMYEWYESTGDLQQLDDAVTAQRRVTYNEGLDYSHCVLTYCNLNVLLNSRYEAKGEIADIHESIKVSRKALLYAGQKHPMHSKALCGLAHALYLLATQGNTPDGVEILQDSVTASMKAFLSTPKGHHQRSQCLTALSNSLLARYGSLGGLDDLEAALELADEAASDVSQDPSMRALHYSNLGNVLRTVYSITMAGEHVERALKAGREAVKVLPPKAVARAQYMDKLGRLLVARHHHWGTLHDIEESITLAEEVIALTPKDGAALPQYLNQLASRLWIRFGRTLCFENIEKAIALERCAMSIAQPTDKNLPDYMSTLAICLCLSTEQTHSIKYINEAVEMSLQAVRLTPRESHIWASRLEESASVSFARYTLTQDRVSLDYVIENLGLVLAATPGEDPSRVNSYVLLVEALSKRGILDGSLEDGQQILDYLAEAIDCQIGQPLRRIDACVLAAAWLYDLSHFDRALKALEIAMWKILPLVTFRALQVSDQQFKVARLLGLAASTCAIAAEAGKDAEYSLQLLELGRGIMLGFTIDNRGDLSNLQSVDPGLSKRFHYLRSELEIPLVDPLEPGLLPSDVVLQHRFQVAQELESVLAEIRELPFLEDFQQLPSAEGMRKLAGDGTIAVINTSVYRNDAFIVTKAAIVAVPLTSIDSDEVQEWWNVLVKDIPDSPPPEKNRKMESLLMWLWKSIVEPVVRTLDYKPSTDLASLPRIRWIGVGAMSLFPFHAAGCHSSDSTENTMSYAISSYISTIKALAYTNEQDLNLGTQRTRLLVVPMSKTAGCSDLPGVATEVSRIDARVKTSFDVTVLESPTRQSVLQRLDTANIIHFACHGVADPRDPGQSHLVLCGGDEQTPDPESTSKLTVQDISRAKAPGAQLAYLSACRTVHNARLDLADEALHLASQFQLAGFSHVVATMWEGKDEFCMDVAADFYDALSQERGPGRVARALHMAVVEVKRRKWRQPLGWAPFVHLGP